MNRKERRIAAHKELKLARKAHFPVAPPQPPIAVPEPPAATSLDLVPELPEPVASISPAQLTANRENSLKSSGPRTPEGKAIVSLDAVKSALTGRTVVLPSDDAVLYQTHIAAFEKELQPAGPQERALVQSLADTRWRLDRIACLEMSLFAKGRLESARIYEGPADTANVMIDLDTSITYEKLLRNWHIQESRLARRREREMTELRSLQLERKAREAADLDRAAEAYLLARHRNQPFALGENGFEFSNRTFEVHLARLTPLRKQQLLKKAQEEAVETMQAAA